MTDPKIPVTEDEFHAYVDNELPPERRSDVEAWLATHPDDAERVQSWRAMAEALHARYDSVAKAARARTADAAAAQMGLWRDRRLPACLHRRRWHRLARAWRGRDALDLPVLHCGRAGGITALCGRSPSSGRGTWQRTRPSAAMADQALRLGSFGPRARLDGIEAGRRPAVAR